MAKTISNVPNCHLFTRPRTPPETCLSSEAMEGLVYLMDPRVQDDKARFGLDA
jgi:hypothetical protein